MGKRYTLTDIAHLKNRRIFIDANILLYLFWYPSQQRLCKEYARYYKQLLRQKNTLVLNFTVVAEVINRAFVLDYVLDRVTANKVEKEHIRKNKKKFRDSAEGQEILKGIYLEIQDKLNSPYFQIEGKDHSKEEINQFLTVDSIDFNDKSIVSICKEYQLVLLTHDADFRHSDIDILSANKKITP